MPNWCDNMLTICASEDVLEAIKNKAKDKFSPHEESEVTEFSFLPFVKHLIPENYEDIWYELNISILGCKWFPKIDDDRIDFHEDCLFITFETPWNPSLEATKHIAHWLREQKFEFNITHSYGEPMMDISGTFEIDSQSEQYL